MLLLTSLLLRLRVLLRTTAAVAAADCNILLLFASTPKAVRPACLSMSQPLCRLLLLFLLERKRERPVCREHTLLPFPRCFVSDDADFSFCRTTGMLRRSRCVLIFL